jgi:hypothetical protein
MAYDFRGSEAVMSVTLMLALLLQLAAITLLRVRLGKGWLRRPVVLLILTSSIYNGLSQIFLAFPSVGEWDIYRQGVRQSFTDSADLVMSCAMFAFTVAYLMTRPERVDDVAQPSTTRDVMRALDWRILICACLPAAILTYAGRGYNGTASSGPTTTLSTNLAATFFVILVVLTSTAFLLRHGTRWFLPVLAAQSALLALAGERTPVITDAVALIVVLAFAGGRVPRIQLTVAAAVTLIAILAITGVRAQQGRHLFQSGNGAGMRATALANGLTGSTTQTESQTPGLVAQMAVRLDGTSFAGAIAQAGSLGQPRMNSADVARSLLLFVPSFAWPTKVSDAALNPCGAEIDVFGLQQVNFLPGLPGLYYGFLSAPWLIALLSVLGLAFGWCEIWVMRECTPARVVLLAGLVIAGLKYEAGLPTMLVQARAGIAIAVVVWALDRATLRSPGLAAVLGSRRPRVGAEAREPNHTT